MIHYCFNFPFIYFVCLLFLLSFTFRSHRCIAALLSCIRQMKTVLIARISWESSCSSDVTSSFVVWRESIYWMRSKAKRQGWSRWVTTISETIPRLVRSNKVLRPGRLKLTPDPISLMSCFCLSRSSFCLTLETRA